MRTLAIALAASLAIVPAIAKDTSSRINEITTPGGITAWLVEEQAIPIVTVQIEFDGGARVDEKGKEGAANLAAGLIEEGAGDMDNQAFAARLDDLNSSIGFSAGRDGFSVSVGIALSDTELGGGVIGRSGNAKTSVVVSASLNGGADWISDASAGGFAYALRTTLLRVAPRRVLATVVGVVGGVTTVTVDGAGGVNKPRLACVTSVLAPVTDDAAPDASFAAGTNNSSDDGDDESGLFTGENPAAFAPVALRAT